MIAPRRFFLGLALAAAIGLSLQSLMWTPDAGGSSLLPGIVQPVERAHAATMQPVTPMPASSGQTAGNAGGRYELLQLPSRPEPVVAPHDLFAAYSWTPPPPPAASPAASVAAAPQAPSLPFTYGGRIEIDGKSIFLLLEGERTHRVSIGESVGEFKLTSSGPQGLVFLHQPTGLIEALTAPGAPIASN